MRLTLTLFGLELDVTFGLAGEEAAFEPYQDAGTIASTAVAAESEPFGEARIGNHFWEPGEGDEDRRVGFR